eukprot:CAMPEP_0173384002 /NCGR_PEP_ID=MMETSP1356-20130122/6572_1 /TAXON_ID=77927 ORGANISM="Hemiselmis virescens, Strain PCC157" /NCGR_SAMPLE_ID=MMETSP1356 /ASSEMBLY_ACC=CAM_ASM_000847 /LENGTH=68 /DNA_ID=CAMNT_0014339145 /DNA_START=119 /DNA_END=325 /DNA_ORIENTATION=+
MKLARGGSLDPNDNNSTESVTDSFDVVKSMHLANDCDPSRQSGHSCVNVCLVKAGAGYDACADMYGYQ